ncbi:protein of unknown function DUF1657 [Desulfotomaculum nigrificans CO-1-SRB]|uniref:DUF1657 domain-containing protein n=1 Tax=Desulfotomaculum nigrificans (strain DSM 14880 / VKM B-2319 / CO-1-SRB) TaxID=868595 RepID=F6B2K9_DESCC|nr:DUF1657 domain-containing protein [Desulfotomaculum nigrificans]AEF93838.1 protein of unknown function DUF1657 [Desulfotomaculum nigrificans CO-1-SRB]
MTVAAQVKQTIASLKGARSTLETFSSIEQNAKTKELLEKSHQKISHVIDNLEQRVKVLEFEEPQYKGF